MTITKSITLLRPGYANPFAATDSLQVSIFRVRKIPSYIGFNLNVYEIGPIFLLQ